MFLLCLLLWIVSIEYWKMLCDIIYNGKFYSRINFLMSTKIPNLDKGGLILCLFSLNFLMWFEVRAFCKIFVTFLTTLRFFSSKNTLVYSKMWVLGKGLVTFHALVQFLSSMVFLKSSKGWYQTKGFFPFLRTAHILKLIRKLIQEKNVTNAKSATCSLSNLQVLEYTREFILRYEPVMLNSLYLYRCHIPYICKVSFQCEHSDGF